MAQDHTSEDGTDPPRTEHAATDESGENRPSCDDKEAVTPRVRVEGEIGESRIPNVDANGLDAQQKKDWPQEIEAKRRRDGRAKGDARFRSLGPQCNGEVSDEHACLPGSCVAACCLQERGARDPSMRMNAEECVGRHIHGPLSITHQPCT